MTMITRVVKYIRQGDQGPQGNDGRNIIVADTYRRNFTTAQWQNYGAVGHSENWMQIANVADFKVGDAIVIVGTDTDLNIEMQLYANVTAVNIANATVTATTYSLISGGPSGENGIVVSVSPESLLVKDTDRNYVVKIQVSDGTEKLQYGSARPGKKYFLCSVLNEGNRNIGDNLVWTFQISSDDQFLFKYLFRYRGGTLSIDLPFTIYIYKDNALVEEIYRTINLASADKGDTTYTWMKFADSVGTNGYPSTMYDTPRATTRYLGLAYNKATPTESDTPSDYVWTNIKGSDGTSFKPKGTANAHYANKTAFDAVPNQLYGYYLFDSNGSDSAGVYSYVPGTDYPFNVSAIGDGWLIDGNLWVKTDDGKWYNFGNLQGPEGPEGPEGPKGDRGPALRGPQAWSDCAIDYPFKAGGAGEEWKDVVLYNGNYYSCTKSHIKTANNYPGSTVSESSNPKLWQLGDKIELVATKILLATYALVENLGVKAIEMYDGQGNLKFLAKDGNVTCKTGTFENITVTGNSTFRGVIEAVTGSFKRLNCVDDNGNVVGGISFGNQRMEMNGDIYNQGYDYGKGRGYRFYSSAIWCRNMFGAAERTVLEIKGSYGYYYTKGAANNGVYVALTAKTSSANETYYEVQCYGQSGDYAGMPVDIVVFNHTNDTMSYNLVMFDSQRVLVVNANDDKNNVQIYSNGSKVTWNGGEIAEVVKLTKFMSPTVANTVLGNGIIIGAFRDNNW